MSMFTIYMDETKYLRSTSKDVNLFQGDNAVDNFQVIIPLYYGNLEMYPFTVCLEYVDENMNAYIDILVPDEDIYKEDFIRYTLPITTKITKSAGTITMKLSMNYVDKEKLIQYSLHSSETQVYIHPVSDYYMFSDDSLNKIDKLIGELGEKAKYVEEASLALLTKVPDDLGFDDEGTLHVTVKGEIVGHGVDVVTPTVEDDFDGDVSGVINLDNVYSSVEL